MAYRFVAKAPEHPAALRPVVIGAGPCGLFAALLLAQMGFRPIILERGKVVRERTKDTWGLWRKRVLNPESNVQFGEGGAGTFSDGKLYSQIKDPRHLGRKVLTEFVKAGRRRKTSCIRSASAYRHVPPGQMVENMRATIEALGGEYRFESRVTDHRNRRRAAGARRRCWQTGSRSLPIMSCWRSATARAIPSRCCTIAAFISRPSRFRIGFRIEHPQSLIDVARFGACAAIRQLGAADYKLVHHASEWARLSTASACAPAARWSRRLPRQAASSPTA